jgi:hypothetical protein
MGKGLSLTGVTEVLALDIYSTYRDSLRAFARLFLRLDHVLWLKQIVQFFPG